MPGWYVWNNWQYFGFNCHQQTRNEIKHKFDTYWYVKFFSNNLIVQKYSHLSDKREVMLTNFGKFHPPQKNPPSTFIDFITKLSNILTEQNDNFNHGHFEL